MVNHIELRQRRQIWYRSN